MHRFRSAAPLLLHPPTPLPRPLLAQGLDFVVDAGPRPAGGTTVIDCTGAEPVVLRQGKGDTAWLEGY